MTTKKDLGELMNTYDALSDMQVVLDRILRYKEKISMIPQNQLTSKQKLWLKSFEASENNFSFETEEGKMRVIEDIAILDEGIERNDVNPQKSNGGIKVFIKKSLLFIALLIVSTTTVGSVRGYSDDLDLFIGIALASLIVFVWNKISKKYLS